MGKFECFGDIVLECFEILIALFVIIDCVLVDVGCLLEMLPFVVYFNWLEDTEVEENAEDCCY